MAQWLDPQGPHPRPPAPNAGYATGHFGKWHMGGQRDVDRRPAHHSNTASTAPSTNFEGMGSETPAARPHPRRPPNPRRIWQAGERSSAAPSPGCRALKSPAVSSMPPSLHRPSAPGPPASPFFVNLWPDDPHGPWYPPASSAGPRTPAIPLPGRPARDGRPARARSSTASARTKPCATTPS
jgi:arylsulfatase A-like enzyme